jgi:hypothetical protein
MHTFSGSGAFLLGAAFCGHHRAGVMVVGAQIFPTVVEYQAAKKAVNKASAGSTVPEVRLIFEKAAAIDDITSIKPKELEVTKEWRQGRRCLSLTTSEIHLVGPAYLVLKYRGRSR